MGVGLEVIVDHFEQIPPGVLEFASRHVLFFNFTQEGQLFSKSFRIHVTLERAHPPSGLPLPNACNVVQKSSAFRVRA